MSRPNMGELLKQVQKIQEEINQAQESLGNLRAEGTAGGGVVTVAANGKQEILTVHLAKEIVDPQDIELLEDLIVPAVNQALQQARELAGAQMNKAAGGMFGNLSGGLKIPGL